MNIIQVLNNKYWKRECFNYWMKIINIMMKYDKIKKYNRKMNNLNN